MDTFLSDIMCDIFMTHSTDISIMKHSHTHPQYELYFCSDCLQQKSIINGTEYIYKYPCVILSSPYTVHAMSSDDVTAEKFERFVLYFDENVLSQIDKSFIPFEIINDNVGYMFKLSNKNADYLKDLVLAFDANNKAELKLLLYTFLNKLISLTKEEDVVCIKQSSFYIQNVLQYIADHYTEQIDSTHISQHFLISRSKLDRDFKQFTGTTIHGFIDMCRINQIKTLLEYSPELSISEISNKCGFENTTYFYPFFKKSTGMTPMEYRKKTLDQTIHITHET